MQRSQRKEAASEASAEASQIQNLAFNVSGHAMRIQVQFKQDVITAYGANTKPYEQAITQATNNDEEAYRADLNLTARELGGPEVGEGRYLIVGFVARATLTKKKELRKVVGAKQGAPVGTARPDNNQLTAHQGALIAVVKIQEYKSNDGVKYWVLIKPKGDLCVPHTVAQNEVFFLPKFRINVGSVKNRAPEWSRQVIKVMEKLVQVAEEPTMKQLMYKRAHDTTRLVFQPKKAVVNELLLYAALHEKTHDPKYLAEMKALLEEIKPDLKAKPRNCPYLRLFAKGGSGDKGMEDDDYKDLVTEVQERWPGIKGVTTESLMLLYQGLVSKGVSVPYRFLRAFIAEGCYRAADNMKDAADLAADVLANVERVLAHEPTPPPISDSDVHTILRVVVEKLKESVQAGQRFEKELAEMAGDVGQTSLVDIWSNYANSLDVDTAKKAFFEVVRIFAAESRTKTKGILGINEDLVEILSGLNLD